MVYHKVRYNIADFPLHNKILVHIAMKRPDGITAKEIATLLDRDYGNIHRMLQRLVLQGFLKRIKTEEKAGNNHPTVLYFATREGKKKVNHLMGRRFGGDWQPLPLYPDGPER